MAHSKTKVMEELQSGPFIFVPDTSSHSDEDALVGSLMSPQDVYWHDIISPVDLTKSDHPECVSKNSHRRKMLQSFYPHLHDFFVNECGVDEAPPFRSYLQILLDLPAITLPHEGAKTVSEPQINPGYFLSPRNLSLFLFELCDRFLRYSPSGMLH